MKNCNECGNPVDIEAGDELVGVGILGHGFISETCRACLSKGWSFDPDEIAEAISNDPELSGKVERLSPIQPEDL